MKCIECGHELKDGAVFCIRCGAMQVSKDGSAKQANTAPVRSAGQGTARHNTAGKSFKPTPRRSTASVVVPIVAVIAVLAAVAALALFVLNPTSSSQSSSSQVSATIAGSSSSSSGSSSSASSSAASSSASSSKSSAASSSASASSSSAAAASGGSAASTGSPNANSGAASTSTGNGAASNSGTTTGNAGSQTYAEPAQTYTEPAATDGSYYRGDTSSRYYSRSEVENMSNYDLYYARNEIFARHGRMFKNSDLQAYFNSKSWYTPTYSPSEWAAMPSPLSDIEQKNSSLMLEVEQNRNSPYL